MTLHLHFYNCGPIYALMQIVIDIEQWLKSTIHLILYLVPILDLSTI